MGLKLTITKGDKITIGSGADTIMAEVLQANGKMVLEFNAPREAPIHAIFQDINKQFKNRRNQ